MSLNSDILALEAATKIMNYLFLGITVLLQILFYMKFKFKVDKASIFILFVYLVVFLSRILLDGSTFTPVDFIQPICTTLVYAALLYYLFEMAYVYSKLTSSTPEHHKKKKRVIKTAKVTMFLLFLGVFLPTNLINHISSES